MKHPKIFSAVVMIILFYAVTYAASVPTFSGELVGDQYFQNGVLLEGVEQPVDQSATTGTSKVTINGSGTLTVGNQIGGGFPRITVVGGTTISSTRVWTEEAAGKTWWDGQFTAPGTGRLPDPYDINYNTVNALEVVSAFSWGLANETFSFSTPARAIFPVSAPDGQKLLIAYKNNGTWSIKGTDFCIVQNELCYVEITSMSDIAFVKELFQTCPLQKVSHGSPGNVPNCIITCDRGYELNEAANGCVPSGEGAFDDGGGDGDAGIDEGGYGGGEDDFFEGGEDYNFEEDTGPSYEFPPGYFRYSGTMDQRMRKLDTEGMDDDQKKLIHNLNRGYLSRNPRSAKEQLDKKKSEKEKKKDKGSDDSFVSYLLQMRSIFREKKLQDKLEESNRRNMELMAKKDTSEEEGEVKDGEKKQNSETFHSGAPLLPSTGPEIFVTIAVVGFLMMLFGARRRN